MKKLVLFVSIFCICMMSCKKNNQPEQVEADLASFAYLKNLRFLLTKNQIEQVLPKEIKIISDNEDGVLYELEKNDIKHQITALFYGNEFFDMLMLELDFTKNKTQQALVFEYLLKELTQKNKAPFSTENNENGQFISWIDGSMQEAIHYKITLSKQDNIVGLNYVIEIKDESNFEHDDFGGEWIQRGEDGEWIFVPD